MIDVEESALGAFEQDVVTSPDCVVQQNDGIGDERTEVIAGRAVLLMDLLKRKRLSAECLQDFVILFNLVLELDFESLRVNQIEDSKAGSGGFIAVGWADAALGGP